jgi:hypothetical protein
MTNGHFRSNYDKVRTRLLVSDLVGTTIVDPVESAINDALVHVGASRVDPAKLAPLRGGLKKRDVFTALLGANEDKVDTAYRFFESAVIDNIVAGRVPPFRTPRTRCENCPIMASLSRSPPA